MRLIGFSTGALALADFHRALRMMEGKHLRAVELSALREEEIKPLVSALPSLNIESYAYVSLHAPSALRELSEMELVQILSAVANRGMPIVLHPDVIADFPRWRDLGTNLYIENMDKRKPIGRTADELDRIFSQLPEAKLCFDIGHARQVDPTMSQAGAILRSHGARLAQIHISEVNASSRHETLNCGAMDSFRRIAHLLPENVPAILEAPVDEPNMLDEVRAAQFALTPMNVIDPAVDPVVA